MFSINYFQSITKNLDLFQWLDELKFNIFNEIDIIINRFWSHPSIVNPLSVNDEYTRMEKLSEIR